MAVGIQGGFVPFASSEAAQAFHDVCIIGSGPAGLATAISLHGRGLRVLLLDAGGRHPVPGSPDVIAAQIEHPNAHWPTELTAAAALGGSSHWWGGRLVQFDQADFLTWPIAYQEMQRWQTNAAQLLGAVGTRLAPPPESFSRLSHFHADDPERWLRRRNVSKVWDSYLRAKDGPVALLQARVTGLNMAGDRIDSVDIVCNGATQKVRARHFVIACGGLGSLRLLLLLQRSNPALFGGPAGPLGRGYMGHLAGSISDLVFADRRDADAFGHVPAPRHVERRRITARSGTVVENRVCNIGFWLAGPDTSNPAHQSAAASSRYLAATLVRSMSGSRVRGTETLKPHLRNVARAPVSALNGLASTIYELTVSRATGQHFRPRRFQSSGNGGWRLVYHAEQRSNPSNRVTLGTDRDSIGVPKLSIDFRFSDADAAAVVDAHALLDQDLRQSGAGSLRYLDADIDARKQRVLATARDGFHQIGGARMSASPHDGVVDPDCRVHGLENLFVVSSCVFPTGGQANPTLMIVALACRLAEHIGGKLANASVAATRKVTATPGELVGAT